MGKFPFKKVVTINGAKFYRTADINTVRQATEDYRFDVIQPTDTVLDIGACIGGYTIPAARLARQVVAIEPVRHQQLEANIKLNHDAGNITVHNIALLSHKTHVSISWMKQTTVVMGIPYTTIKQYAQDGVDILKCDCEGAEWYINPSDLADVRHIDMELHRSPRITNEQIKLWVEALKKTHTVTLKPSCDGIIACAHLYADRRDELHE